MLSVIFLDQIIDRVCVWDSFFLTIGLNNWFYGICAFALSLLHLGQFALNHNSKLCPGRTRRETEVLLHGLASQVQSRHKLEQTLSNLAPGFQSVIAVANSKQIVSCLDSMTHGLVRLLRLSMRPASKGMTDHLKLPGLFSFCARYPSNCNHSPLLCLRRYFIIGQVTSKLSEDCSSDLRLEGMEGRLSLWLVECVQCSV